MDGLNSVQLYRLEASCIRSSFAENDLMFLVRKRICDSTFQSKNKNSPECCLVCKDPLRPMRNVISSTKVTEGSFPLPDQGWSKVKLRDNNIYKKSCKANHSPYFLPSIWILVNPVNFTGVVWGPPDYQFNVKISHIFSPGSSGMNLIYRQQGNNLKLTKSLCAAQKSIEVNLRSIQITRGNFRLLQLEPIDINMRATYLFGGVINQLVRDDFAQIKVQARPNAVLTTLTL